MNLKYTRWKGQSTGIWRRRLAIVRYGCRLSLKSKILKITAAFCFGVGVALIAAFFLLGQLVSPESSLLNLLSANNDKLKDILNGFASWILVYPEICVDGYYRAMFYASIQLHSFFAVIAIATFIPKLCAQDIASNAIVIYNSKALGKGDYILGKLGVVLYILSCIWIVPMVVAWVFGNAMSPDWSYFYHSSLAFARAMTVVGIGVVAMSFLAMAISSLTQKSGISVIIWIFYWVFSNVVASAVSTVYSWGEYISLNRAFDQLALVVFRFDLVLQNAQEMIPFFDYYTKDALKELPSVIVGGDVSLVGPLTSIAIHVALSFVVLSKRFIRS